MDEEGVACLDHFLVFVVFAELRKPGLGPDIAGQ